MNWPTASYIIVSVGGFLAIIGTGYKMVTIIKTRWISEADKQRTQHENTVAVTGLTTEIKRLRDMLTSHIEDRTIHRG